MIALLVLLSVCAAGALLARRADPGSSRLVETLALGAPIGLALFAAFGFVLGWAFGLSAITALGAAALTVAAAVAFGVRPRELARLQTRRPAVGTLLLCAFTIAIVARLADRTLIESEAGIATGDRHNFGDLPFHMAIAAGFAYGDNFPPAHPELAGVPLTYPFFCDLISGMILAIGGSWRDAFFWPTLILGLSVVVAIVRFGEAVTSSRALGRISAALTFASGGLGFVALSSREALLNWWQHGPDLTINETGLRYANFITTLFIPQRSILFGWPLLFFALALLVESLKEDSAAAARPTKTELWLRAGALASLLPLVHAHSFAVLGFCALLFATRAGWTAAFAYAKGVIPLAAPALLFMVTHNSLSTGRFFAWQTGFDGGHDQPLRYWVMNAGFFLPLVIAGVVRAIPPLRFVAAPFVCLFVSANLFRLSPWIWDNMKFLAPAHAGLAPFAALALGLAWRRGRVAQAASIALFCVSTVSGALDVSKVMMSAESFPLFDKTGLEFAAKVRNATAPGTTILTAPAHDHPVLLSGRRVFLGYEGHLWSQGLDYAGRKPVAAAVFAGQPQPGTPGSIIRIDSIALTPEEVALVPDFRMFEGLPSVVDSPYRLLTVR